MRYEGGYEYVYIGVNDDDDGAGVDEVSKYCPVD